MNGVIGAVGNGGAVTVGNNLLCTRADTTAPPADVLYKPQSEGSHSWCNRARNSCHNSPRFFQSALPTTLPLPPFCLEEKHDTREGLLSYCLLCEMHRILEVMNLNGVKT